MADNNNGSTGKKEGLVKDFSSRFRSYELVDELAAIEKQLRENPRDAKLWMRRGLLLSELQRLDEAIVSFDKAFSLDGTFITALNAKANTLTRMNRLAEAALCYQKINQLSSAGRPQPPRDREIDDMLAPVIRERARQYKTDQKNWERIQNPAQRKILEHALSSELSQLESELEGLGAEKKKAPEAAPEKLPEKKPDFEREKPRPAPEPPAPRDIVAEVPPSPKAVPQDAVVPPLLRDLASEMLAQRRPTPVKATGEPARDDKPAASIDADTQKLVRELEEELGAAKTVKKDETIPAKPEIMVADLVKEMAAAAAARPEERALGESTAGKEKELEAAPEIVMKPAAPLPEKPEVRPEMSIADLAREMRAGLQAERKTDERPPEPDAKPRPDITLAPEQAEPSKPEAEELQASDLLKEFAAGARLESTGEKKAAREERALREAPAEAPAPEPAVPAEELTTDELADLLKGLTAGQRPEPLARAKGISAMAEEIAREPAGTPPEAFAGSSRALTEDELAHELLREQVESPPAKPAAEAKTMEEKVKRGLEKVPILDALGRKQRIFGHVNGLGRVNGLVNGSGRINGLVNGRRKLAGIINGSGRINGMVNGRQRLSGMINGRGRVNGLVNGKNVGGNLSWGGLASVRSLSGRINGRGRINGMVNGRRFSGNFGKINGMINGSGRINGLINGRGRINGMTNGRGRINGLGRINGRINGAGRINGMINGRINGAGRINGRTNGRGRINGMINGAGRINGMINGRRKLSAFINGTGRVNGWVNGRRLQGQINGLTSPRGKINGRVNGSGRINGLINGRGQVNGLVNGMGYGPMLYQHRRADRRMKVRDFVLVMSVVVVMLAGVLLMYMPQKADDGISIDGNFSDWSGIPLMAESGAVANPNIAIRNYTVDFSHNKVSFYLEVKGLLLEGENPLASSGRTDSVHIFIDTDMNPATGYSIHGMGADYMIQVSGRNQAPSESALYYFHTDSRLDPGRLDWKGWTSVRDVPASVAGSRLETQVFPFYMGLDRNNDGLNVLFHTADYMGQEDFSAVIVNTRHPSLYAYQEPVSTKDSVLEPNIYGSTPVLNVRLETLISNVSVNSMQFRVDTTIPESRFGEITALSEHGKKFAGRVVGGTAVIVPTIGNIEIDRNSSEMINVFADLQFLYPEDKGKSYGIWLESVGTEQNAVVTMKNNFANIRKYIVQPPDHVIIDGAFGDWKNTKQDTVGDVNDSNIDIVRYDAKAQGSDAMFYLRVDGTLLGGKTVPVIQKNITISKPLVPDSDRDTMNDSVDPMPLDFNNDGTNDSATWGTHHGVYGPDVDGDGITDYPQGPDKYLNTTIPDRAPFPPDSRGKRVSVDIGPIPPTKQNVPGPNTGEDWAYAFIDSDNNSKTGFPNAGLQAAYAGNSSAEWQSVAARAASGPGSTYGGAGGQFGVGGSHQPDGNASINPLTGAADGDAQGVAGPEPDGIPSVKVPYGTDYIILISGRENVINCSRLYEWKDGNWSFEKVVNCGIDSIQIEFSAALQDMNITGNFSVHYQFMNWVNAQDTARTLAIPYRQVTPVTGPAQGNSTSGLAEPDSNASGNVSAASNWKAGAAENVIAYANETYAMRNRTIAAPGVYGLARPFAVESIAINGTGGNDGSGNSAGKSSGTSYKSDNGTFWDQKVYSYEHLGGAKPVKKTTAESIDSPSSPFRRALPAYLIVEKLNPRPKGPTADHIYVIPEFWWLEVTDSPASWGKIVDQVQYGYGQNELFGGKDNGTSNGASGVGNDKSGSGGANGSVEKKESGAGTSSSGSAPVTVNGVIDKTNTGNVTDKAGSTPKNTNTENNVGTKSGTDATSNAANETETKETAATGTGTKSPDAASTAATATDNGSNASNAVSQQNAPAGNTDTPTSVTSNNDATDNYATQNMTPKESVSDNTVMTKTVPKGVSISTLASSDAALIAQSTCANETVAPAAAPDSSTPSPIPNSSPPGPHPMTAYTAAGSGEWNAAATWVGNSGYPVAGDTANIGAYTISITSTGGNAAATTVNFTADTAQIAINGGYSLTVSGTLTLNNLAAANISATISGAGSLTANAIAIGNGTTPTGAIYTTTLNSTITSSTITTNLTINSSFVSVSVMNNGKFSLQSGATTVNGTVNLNGANAANTTTFTMAEGSQNATLNLGGATPWTIGSGTCTTTLNGTSATVNYSGAAQTVRAVIYQNLTLSSSGTKTLTSLTTISGNLYLTGSSVSATTAANMTVGGTLTIDTTCTFTTGANYTLAVTGATSVTGTLANTNTGNNTYTGLVTINSGGSWTNASDSTVTFKGGFTNNSAGTVTFGAGVQTFNTNAQAVGGTNSITIPSMTVNIGVTNNFTGSASLIVSTALAGSSTLTQAANANLTISFAGSAITAGLDASTNSGNTVTYNANGGQTIKAITYSNLTINGAASQWINSGTTVNGNLTIGGTVSAQNFADLSVGGNLSVGAGSTFTAGAYALTVSGTTTVTGASSNLTISSATGTKTFTGLVTINTNANWNNNSSNSDITMCGGLTVNSTAFYAGSGVYYFTTNAQNIGGSAAITIQNLTVTTITLTNQSTAGLTVSAALSGTGGLTQDTNAVLNISGTSGITTLTASASGNTVNYNGAAQTVNATATYYHLTLSGSGAKTLQTGTTTISGNLTLSGSVSTTTVVGLAISGNLSIGNGTTFTAASTFTLTVTGTTTVGGGSSGTLTISSTSGQKTFTGLVTVNGSATWNNSGNCPITMQGGLTFNGTTFTAGSGVYTFDTNAQGITGTVSIPSVTVTTVTLTNNNTLTVGTALIGTGGLTQAASATLNIGGTSTITTLTATASGNTVNYTGAAQTLHSNNYYNLTLSGSGTVILQTGTTTISGNLTLSGTVTTTTVVDLAISGSLSVGTGTTFTNANFVLTVPSVTVTSTGTLTNNGTLTVSTIAISGATTITNNGTVTASSDITGTASGSTWTNAANSTLNAAGTMLATGTLTATASGNTVYYNSTTVAQTIKGTTYVNLTINKAGQIGTLGANTIVNGTLTVTAGTLQLSTLSLTANGATSISGTIDDNSSTGTNLFVGLVTINSGGVWTSTGGAAYEFRGGLTMSGTTFTSGAGVYTFSTNAQNIGGSAFTIQNLTVSANVTNQITTGGLTVSAALSGTSGSLIQDTNAILNISGTSGITTLTATASGNTVYYNNTTTDQTINGTTYVNLTINKTNRIGTLGAATIVNGTLTVTTGTLQLSTLSLTANGATSISGTIDDNSSTGTNLFVGLVTINSGGVWTSTGGAAYEFRGGLTMSGTTFTSGAGIYTFTTNAQNIGGSTAITIQNLTVTTITLTNQSTVGLTVSVALSGTGGLTQDTNAILNISGTSGITTLTATTSGNIVNYNGSATQTMKGTTYVTLKINNSAGATLGAAATVTTLTIGDVTASSIFADGGFQVTSTGTLTLTSGTFKLGSAGTATTWPAFATNTISSGTTVEYASGQSQTVSNTPSYQNLTFSGAGTKTTASGTLSIGATWTIGSTTSIDSTTTVSVTSAIAISGAVTATNNGAVTGSSNITGSMGGSTWVNAANSTLNVAGTMLTQGTLTATASGNTVNYNGGAQTVNATATYYHLTLSGSGAKTLQTGTTTISGNLTLSGTASTTTVVGLTISGNLSVGDGTTFTAASTFTLTVTGTTTVGGGSSGTLTISSTSGQKTFTGLVTVNGSATWNNSGNCPITMRGGLTFNGTTFTAGSGLYTFDTNAQNIGGSTALAIPSITTTIALTNNGTLTVATALTCTSPGVLTNNSTVTATTALSGNGGFTQGTNATLNIGGTSGITTLTATNSGNTVNYTGGAQNVHSNNYYNLVFSGGAKTFAGPNTISANLSISSGASANLNTYNSSTDTLTLNGSGQPNGTFGGTGSGATYINTTYFAAVTGVLTVNTSTSPAGTWLGTTSTDWNTASNWSGGIPTSSTDASISSTAPNQPSMGAAGGTCNTLTINTGATLTLTGGTLTVVTNVTFNGTITATTSASTLSVGGTWTGAGTTFTPSTYLTVNFTGASQTVPVLVSNYYNLTLSGSGTDVLQAGTATIGGTLTLSGTVSTTTVVGLAITGNLSVGNGTTFTAASTYTLSVAGTTTVGGGSSGTLTISSTSGQKTFTGLVTVNGSATWNNSGNCPITMRGGLTNSGTFTAGSGVYTFDTNAQALNGIISIPSVTVTGVTLTNNNTLTVGTALSGSGGLSNAATGILNIGGSSGITTLSASISGNTVNFTGTGQTLNVVTYHHLTLSGGAETFGAITTINGNLTLSGSATATTGAGLTVGGNLSIGNGTTLTIGAFTLTVSGTTTVGGGTSGSLVFSSATNPTKTFVGLVTINASASWTESFAITPEFRGGITTTPTFTGSTGVHSFTTNAQALNGTFSIPSVTVTTVTLTNNNTLTVSTALSGSGGLSNAATGILNIGGTSGITTLSASISGNTVNFTGTGQTLNVVTYHHLTLSGGAETFGAITTINGNLTLSGSATATTGAGLTVSGNLSIGNGTTFTAAGYILTVTGTTTVGGGASGNLTISSATGTKTFADLTISGGTLTCVASGTVVINGNVSNSGTLTASSSGISVTGNWSNSGTFTAGTSTVTFNGSSDCTIDSGGTGAGKLFSSVTVNTPSHTLSVINHDIEIDGTFTITSGTFQITTGNINLTTKGSVTVQSGGTLKLQADSSGSVRWTVQAGTTVTNNDGGTLNFTGYNGTNRVQLRSSTTSSWTLTDNTTSTSDPIATNVDVEYSDASSGNTIYATSGTNRDGGNNLNWVFAAGGDTISGRLYSDEGTTPITTGGISIRLSINGAAYAATTTTDTNGDYSLIATTGSGDILTLYINHTTYRAATVTITNGGDLTGSSKVDIYEHRLIVRNDNSGATANTDLSTANNGDSLIRDVYTDSSNVITTVSGYHLYVWGSYTPGANVTVNGNLTIRSSTGSLTSSSETITITGNWSNNGGTFTAGTGTVTFSGTTQSISGSSTTAFYNITVGTGSSTTTLSVTTTGCAATNALTVTSSSGTNTFKIDATSGNVTFYVGSGSGTGTITHPATEVIQFAGANTASLQGYTGHLITWDPAGTITTTDYTQIGYVAFGATAKSWTTSVTFNNACSFAAGFTVNGGGKTVTLGAAMDFNSTVTLTNGTLAPGSYTHTVAGNWDDSADSNGFNPAAGTFQFDGTESITQQTGSITNSFFNLTVSAGTCTASTNIDINGSFTLSSGTFAPGANTITVAGNWDDSNGTFTPTAGGTITFDGSTAQSITSVSTNNFYNLTITNSGSVTVSTSSSFGIKRYFTHSGNATFTASSPSVITFNGTINQQISALSADTFYDLTYSTSTSSVYLQTSSSFNISHNYSNTCSGSPVGYLLATGGAITFTGTVDQTISSKSTDTFYTLAYNSSTSGTRLLTSTSFNISYNFTNSSTGSPTVGVFVASSPSVITFNGVNIQTISSKSGDTFYDFTYSTTTASVKLQTTTSFNISHYYTNSCSGSPAGYLSATGGTITFNGTVTQTIASLSADTFYSLTYASTTSGVHLDTTSSFNIAKDYTNSSSGATVPYLNVTASSIITFNGVVNQTISSQSTDTFYDLNYYTATSSVYLQTSTSFNISHYFTNNCYGATPGLLSATTPSTITLNGGTQHFYTNSGDAVFNLTISSSGTVSTDNAIDINGDFKMTSGTFSSINSHTVAGNWDDSGGTYQAGFGSITFDKNGAQTVKTKTGNYFYSISVMGSSSLSYASGCGILQVTNLLYVYSGGTFTMAGGNQLTMGVGGGSPASGNIWIYGTFNASGTSPSKPKIIAADTTTPSRTAFTMYQGTINVTALNYSYGDANGMYFSFAGATAVTAFNNVDFDHGTTTMLKLGSGVGAFTGSMAWDGWTFTSNDSSPKNITTVAGKSGNVSMTNYSGTGSGGANCSDPGITINWASSTANVWDGGGTDNNWTTAANWGSDTVPAAAANVIFDHNYSSKNCTLDAAESIGTLTSQNSYIGTITLNATLTATGIITIIAGCTLTVGGAGSINTSNYITVAGTMNGSGSLLLSYIGDPIQGAGTITLNSINATYNGAGAQTVEMSNFASLTINNSGTKTVAGTITANITITNALNVNDTATFYYTGDNTYHEVDCGSCTVDSGAAIRVGYNSYNNAYHSDLKINGTSGTVLTCNGTILDQGGYDQIYVTITSTASVSFTGTGSIYHLILAPSSGTPTYTFTGTSKTLTITSEFEMSSSVTLAVDDNANTLKLTGTGTVYGTTYTNLTFNSVTGGTIWFAADANNTAANDDYSSCFYNLKIGPESPTASRTIGLRATITHTIWIKHNLTVLTNASGTNTFRLAGGANTDTAGNSYCKFGTDSAAGEIDNYGKIEMFMDSEGTSYYRNFFITPYNSSYFVNWAVAGTVTRASTGSNSSYYSHSCVYFAYHTFPSSVTFCNWTGNSGDIIYITANDSSNTTLLTVTNGATFTIAGPVILGSDVDHSGSIYGDTIDLGDASTKGNLTISGSGASLTANASSSPCKIYINGNWTNTATVYLTYSTVYFDGFDNQTIISGGTASADQFSNVTINNTGTGKSVQLSTNSVTQIASYGVLTMTAGTLDLNGFVWTLGVNLSYSAGTIQVGTGQLVGGTTYNITVDNGGTLAVAPTTSTDSVTCIDFTLNATGTFTHSGSANANIVVSGNVTVSGTFTHNSNTTIRMYGGADTGSAKTLSASSTIYNLKIQPIGGSQGYVTCSSNLTMAGDLDIIPYAAYYCNANLRFNAGSNAVTAKFGDGKTITITTSGAYSGSMTFYGNTTYAVTLSSNNEPPTTKPKWSGNEPDWDSGGAGSKVTIKYLDFATNNVSTSTDGAVNSGTVTITMAGDCDFDAVTVSSGDTWVINGGVTMTMYDSSSSHTFTVTGTLKMQGSYSSHAVFTGKASKVYPHVIITGTMNSYYYEFQKLYTASSGSGVKIGTGDCSTIITNMNNGKFGSADTSNSGQLLEFDFGALTGKTVVIYKLDFDNSALYNVKLTATAGAAGDKVWVFNSTRGTSPDNDSVDTRATVNGLYWVNILIEQIYPRNVYDEFTLRNNKSQKNEGGTTDSSYDVVITNWYLKNYNATTIYTYGTTTLTYGSASTVDSTGNFDLGNNGDCLGLYAYHADGSNDWLIDFVAWGSASGTELTNATGTSTLEGGRWSGDNVSNPDANGSLYRTGGYPYEGSNHDTDTASDWSIVIPELSAFIRAAMPVMLPVFIILAVGIYRKRKNAKSIRQDSEDNTVAKDNVRFRRKHRPAGQNNN